MPASKRRSVALHDRARAALKQASRWADSIGMEQEIKLARPSLWVFGMLFLAYLVTHVVLLLFVYAVVPSTPFVLAEVVAIAGGALAARVTLLLWRRSARA